MPEAKKYYEWVDTLPAASDVEINAGAVPIDVGSVTKKYTPATAAGLAAHIADTNDPHNVTAAQVGLGNVNNTSDLNKPISTATQSALDNKLDDTVTINGYAVSGSPSLTAADVGTVAVTTTSPAAGEVLIYNGATFVNGNVPTSAGAGVSYFFTNTASSIGSYEIISKTPDTVAEQVEPVTVTSATSPVYLDHAYITDTAIGVTTLDAGLWSFGMYANCSATNGTNTLTIEVYKRTSGGTETLLFSASTVGSIVDSVTELYPINTVQPAYSCSATDKLVFKIKASTDRASSTTINWIHSGATNYSNIQTPLSIPHNSLLGTQGGDDNEKYHLNLTHYTIATQAATASLDGYLSSTKFAEFDAKQPAGSYITASSTDTLTNKTFTRYLETIAEPAISAGTLTIDCSSNNNFWVAHNANITTLAFSDVPTAGVQYTANLVLTQDATGTRTFPITATTSVYKVMGATIAFNTAANAINTVTLVTKDGGVTWLTYFNKVS